MKEFQDIQKINIRLAQKFEKMGFFKEADEIDNMNLIFSQRIIVAGGPGRFDFLEIGDSIPNPVDKMSPLEIANLAEDKSKVVKQSFNTKAFLDGIGKAYQKVTGKEINLSKFLPNLPGLNKALGNIFGAGAIFFGVASFFIGLSNDQSGAYGDSPKELAEIVSNLAGVVSGFSMIAAAGGGGNLAVAIAGVAGLIQVAINLYLQLFPDSLEDELDYGRKSYTDRGAQGLIQNAYRRLHPNKSYEQNKDNLTPAEIKALQDKIGAIAKEGNYKTRDVQEAFSIIAQNSRQAPMKKEDIGKLYGLGKKPEVKPGMKPSKINPYYGFGFTR